MEERHEQEKQTPSEPLPPVGMRVRAAVAVVLLTVATAMVGRALASPLYKSVDADSDMLSGEARPGAIFVDRLKLLPSPLPLPAVAGAEAEARAALAASESGRTEAKVPLPDERAGDDDGRGARR